MKKTLKHLLLCFSLVLALFIFAEPAQAAILKSYNFTSTKSFSLDMTHDGKADTIKVVPTKEYDYITKVRIYLNGQLVKTETFMNCFSLNLQYIKFSNNREFINLYGTGESRMPYIQHVYYYDKATKTFKYALDLSKHTGAGYTISSVRADDYSFTVKYNCQPSPTGRISWTYRYKYDATTKKFKLVSPYATPKCAMTYDPGDGLTKYFKVNKYKTNKALTVYSDKLCTKYSCTIPTGKFLEMTKVYTTSAGNIYIQFKYGTKLVWIKVYDTDHYFDIPFDCFKGVNNRLAGGFYS